MDENKPPLESRLVDRSSSQDLTCAICLGLLHQPMQCRNGHLFCSDCISRSILKNPKCPSCRCSLSQGDLSRSLFVEKHLRTLLVWCVYHFVWLKDSKTWELDKLGCPFKDEVQNIDKHECDCGYLLVQCPHNRVCGKIRKKDLESHVLQCEWRIVNCEFCSQSIPACKMGEHLQICSCVKLQCQLCNETMRRCDLTNHLLKSCPENEISCPYSGCEVKIKRKNLTTHLQDSLLEHLEGFRVSTQKMIESMEANYANELRRKDQEIHILKKRLTSETKAIWKIDEWSKVSHKAYVQSKYFQIGCFEWFMGLYPDGDQEGSRGNLSVYLFLKELTKGELITQGKTILVEFRVTLVNHKSSKRSLRKDLKTRFPVEDGQGWGERQLAKREVLTDEAGFLLQDTLHILVDITIKQVVINIS